VCLGGLVVLPLVRADDSDVRAVGARVAALALLALLAALVLGWSPLVPVALLLAGGLYGAQLAIDDAPLDAAAPVVAAALLVAAELAYWSLEERERIPGDPGSSLGRAALVAGIGAAALVVSALLLALVDVVSARGLAFDLVGAAAAAAALAAVVLAARSVGRSG